MFQRKCIFGCHLPLLVADLSFRRDQTDFKIPKLVWFYTHLVLVWELFNPPKKFVYIHGAFQKV